MLQNFRDSWSYTIPRKSSTESDLLKALLLLFNMGTVYDCPRQYGR